MTPLDSHFHIGWDVGGAHLKVAVLNAQGRLIWVQQVPCPLWLGISHLQVAIDQVMQTAMPTLQLKPSANIWQSCTHFITMTGELVDLFEHRQQGVAMISQLMQNVLMGEKWFYAMPVQPHSPPFWRWDALQFDRLTDYWQALASANWHASAALLAQHVENALLIDIGSTTSDFTIIKGHRLITHAYTDAARMQAQTLIYTGVVRTPVMALGHSVMFNSSLTTVAAELFATTADIYRITQDLNEDDDMADTADNAEKSPQASAKRLARMIGYDAHQFEYESWQQLALAFKKMHLTRLLDVARVHLREADMLSGTQTPIVVGAGVGSFLVKEIAALLGFAYREVSEVLDQSMHKLTADHNMPNFGCSKLLQTASTCLPAVAVATLGTQMLALQQQP